MRMACRKCNEQRRKKVNEARKRAIVKSYIRDWRKLLLIMTLSVSIYYILASIARMPIDLLSNSFRLSLLVLILLSWFFTFVTWAKMKPGFLSVAGLMFVVAPVLEFKEPVESVVFFCLLASLFLLLLDICLGVIFKVKVTPAERPWCSNREIKHDAKRGKDER